MAESNPTQVILTDDGLKIIKAQNTADNATSGVTNLNDPNLMSVIEKQNNVVQFAGLTSQYNVLVQNAKDEGIDTTAVTTAYNNLNQFMAGVLADPDYASDVDRVTYKKYQDAYNEELSNLQNALQNNANNKFTSAASATSQAASMASQAFSAADSAYNYANSEIATQSSATAKAQSAASAAVTQASSAAADSKDAKQIAGAVSQSYKTLTDGSTMTIAELQSGLAAKLTKSDLDGYSTQTWTQNQIKMTADGINGNISSIKSTVDSQTTSINNLQADSNGFKDQFTKVNNTISQHTTDIGTLQSDAKSLSSNFDSLDSDNKTNKHDISELQQTSEKFSSTLETVKQGNETIKSSVSQLSSDINLRVATKDLIDQINIQAGNTLISSSGQLTLSGKTIYFDSTNPVIIPSANIDKLLVDKKLTAADISANTFTTNNGTFTVDKNGAVVASNLTIRGVTNLVYNAALLGNNGSYIPGWNISGNGVCWPNVMHDGVPSIGWNNSAGGWNLFAQTKLHPLNGATGQPYSASVWFKEYGSDTGLVWDLSLTFFDSNGNPIEGAYHEQRWNGIGSEQDWRYVTIDNAVAPSNAAYVGLQYWVYNGHGNACFSSPMLTQTAQSTGYQPDTGNVISAGEIDGSVINGATINTPNLQLGTNGTLNEDWTLNQDTSLFNPKKGSGTMTLTKGLLATSGTLSRWWSNDGGYWYGIGDDGSKIKDGSNQVGDNYGAGYAQHNIFDSKGNTLLRLYMDATGIYMNSGGASSVNTVLTQQGLTTTNIDALGTITGASLATNGWIDAGTSNGHGIRIGFQTVQSHNSQDIYFNGDDSKQSVTIHAKAIIQSSQLSRKKDIKPLDPDYAMKIIRDSDMYGYRYNEDAPTEPLHYSGIIDDVNGTPQFKMPDEFISEDRTGRNDGNTVAFLVEALKQADKRIGILEGMMNRD